MDRFVETDDMEKYSTGERTLPIATKLCCTVCRGEQADGCLLLDMVGHILEDPDSKIWNIVEKHLCLELGTSCEPIAGELFICNICWEIVYKFHVLSGMVHQNRAETNLYGSIEMDSKETVSFVHDHRNDEMDDDPLRDTDLVNIKDETSDSTTDANEDLVTIKDETSDSTTDANEDVEEEYLIPMPAPSTEVDRVVNQEETVSKKSATIGRPRKSLKDPLAFKYPTPVKAKKAVVTTFEPDQEVLDFYKRIVCEICDLERLARDEPGIEYQTLKELNLHMRKEHNNVNPALRCPICRNKYRGRVQLLKHKEMHLNPENFRCKQCFEVHHNMEEHVKYRHNNKRLHSCSECGKSYDFPSRLAKHVRMAHAPRDVICDHCNKPFSKQALDEHKRATRRARFICEYCSRTFKSRFFLRQHISEEHNESGSVARPVTCPVCSAVLKNKNALDSHTRRMHREQFPVSCSSCGKSFRAKHDLYKHMKNVCTERKFACVVCGKRFKQQVKLDEHMTTHTGRPLYVCNFCPKTFKFESYFYIHRKKAHPEQWLAIKQKGLHKTIQRIQELPVEFDLNT